MEEVKAVLKRHVQNQSGMRSNNEKLVLNIIRDNQDSSISRADIAKITKMSATSITRITESLIEAGLVRQTDSVVNGSVGRNGIGLQAIPEAVLTLGISIDSDYIDLCILNFIDVFTGKKRIKLRKESIRRRKCWKSRVRGRWTCAERRDAAWRK